MFVYLSVCHTLTLLDQLSDLHKGTSFVVEGHSIVVLMIPVIINITGDAPTRGVRARLATHNSFGRTDLRTVAPLRLTN